MYCDIFDNGIHEKVSKQAHCNRIIYATRVDNTFGTFESKQSCPCVCFSLVLAMLVLGEGEATVESWTVAVDIES